MNAIDLLSAIERAELEDLARRIYPALITEVRASHSLCLPDTFDETLPATRALLLRIVRDSLDSLATKGR